MFPSHRTRCHVELRPKDAAGYEMLLSFWLVRHLHNSSANLSDEVEAMLASSSIGIELCAISSPIFSCGYIDDLLNRHRLQFLIQVVHFLLEILMTRDGKIHLQSNCNNEIQFIISSQITPGATNFAAIL